MKALIAIALLSVASALPRPETYQPIELPRPQIPGFIDFRPLIVPNEVIEAAKEAVPVEANQDDSGIAVHFVDSPIDGAVHSEDAGVAVRFVDSSLNEEQTGDAIAVRFVDNNEENTADDAAIAVNFVDSPVNEVQPADASAVRFVDNNDENIADDIRVAVNFVDSPVNEVQPDDAVSVRFVDNNEENIADDSGVAVNFVDFPVNEEVPVDDSGIAVNFVDSAANEGDVIRVADIPINDESPIDFGSFVNFVDASVEPETAKIINIFGVFEPISASELETIRIVEMPINTDDVMHYPAKIFDNPMLR